MRQKPSDDDRFQRPALYYDPSWIQPTPATILADVCVYGGTAAGIVAAVKVAQLGKTVIFLQPGKHLGGLTTGGLGLTDYAKREGIFQNHVHYQLGLYWHMANASAIPARYRSAYQRWGLPRDEFRDTGHWPHQLYIREARRMVSDYVMTESDCRLQRAITDSIGMGSYNMDSHNCSRFVKTENGIPRVLNEGDVQVPPRGPYPIPYRIIIPKRGECENLIVPICMSASHIAYGSIRMEPVFMVLGESTAVAAVMALDAHQPVQNIDVSKLRQRLLADGQVLTVPSG